MSPFEQFWQAYPNKKARGAVEKKYQKIDAETHSAIMLALDAQKRYRLEAKKNGEFVPEWCMPLTWLNQQRWLDEIPSHGALKEKAAQKICAVAGCDNFVHAPKSIKPFCVDHFSLDEHKKLRSDCRLTDKLREQWLKHPEIHNLKGDEALNYMNQAARRLKIVR